jgi:hypothetical protein
MKHFKNFPAEFEQYNPDTIEQYATGYETFDENRKLHSYNDEPSYAIVYAPGERQVVYWHSHGELDRPDNKPVSISTVQGYQYRTKDVLGYLYRTNDEQGNSHSYNDLPATMELRDDRFILTWLSHGKKHRDNGLPAEIVCKISPSLGSFILDEENYYLDGEKHREGELPALDGASVRTWYVKDTRHNTCGSAYSKDYSNVQTHYEQWYLYGVQFAEQLFNNFKHVETTYNVPSWVAFLIIFEMVTLKDVEIMREEEFKCNLDIPFVWVLRSLGITEETFLDKLKTFADNNRFKINFVNTSFPKRSHFETFVRVVTAEKENRQLAVLNKGETYV